MKIGDKVTYTDEGGKNGKGTIFAIRRAEAEGKESIISYVVDTGKKMVKTYDVLDDNREIVESKEYKTDQPVTVDVRPDQIQKV